MPDRVYFSDELLQPISPETPAGRDLRYEPLFSQILEARRADDRFDVGAWEKEEGRKAAEWDKVADLSLAALTESSKDLRLACFLTEAAIHLRFRRPAGLSAADERVVVPFLGSGPPPSG